MPRCKKEVMVEKMNFAAKIYLTFLVAENYREQAPAWAKAKNRDLLWLLVPVAGFAMFIAAVEDRYRHG